MRILVEEQESRYFDWMFNLYAETLKEENLLYTITKMGEEDWVATSQYLANPTEGFDAELGIEEVVDELLETLSLQDSVVVFVD